MAHTMGRNLDLNLCFIKIKFPLQYSQSSTTPEQDHSRSSSASRNNLMIIRNFNSLYDSSSSAASDTLDHDGDDDAPAAPADFATAFASRRFFFSAPGRSNSIVDSSPAATATVALVGNSVAVPTLSPDPHADFRRSMQEMLEARELAAVAGGNNDGDSDGMNVKKSRNWEFLHELLLCYLALNPKSNHKFIIGAFSDLVVSLLPPLPPENGGRPDVDLAAAAVSDR